MVAAPNVEARLPPELLARTFTLALGSPPPLGGGRRTAPDPLLPTIARLSRRWLNFAQSRLYVDITLRSHDPAALLLRTLHARPALAALVRRLSLDGTDPGPVPPGATPTPRPLTAPSAHQLVAACSGLSFLSLSYLDGFAQAGLGPPTLPATLRELVLCRTHCPWASAAPHPALERLTLYGLSPELSPDNRALLHPATFPNLRALALMGYDGGVLGPCPGPPSIVARVSSHYNDFGPDDGYPPDASATILWQFGEFEATCQWEETFERWTWSGLKIRHVRFQRWSGRERYSEPGGNTVLYERILREAEMHGPLFASLELVYLSDPPTESGEEQAALDLVVVECGRRGVEVVFEREAGEGESYMSEHFLAKCEERARIEE